MPDYRFVCKRWKNGLDSFYRTHLSLEPFNYDKHRYLTTKPHYSVPSDDYHVILYGLRGINRRLKIADSLNFNLNTIRGNKIIFELIHNDQVCVTSDEICKQHFDAISAILQKVGRHVFYVEIWTYTTTMNCTTLYVGLQRCLTLLPNLRSVILNIAGHVEYDVDDEHYVQNLIETRPLPFMQYLKVCEFNINGLPPDLKDYIFSQYGGLIEKFVARPYNFYDIFVHLPNLSELELHCVNNVQLLFNILRRMVQNGVRLHKIVCDVNADCKIMDVLNELRPLDIREARLRRFEFDSGNFEESDGIDNFEPIPSLRTLEIEDGSCLTYIFLSKLPNLEFLYVRGKINYQDTDYPFEPYVRNEINMCIHDCLYFCIPPPLLFWKTFSSLKELYTLDEDIEFARQESLKYRYPRVRFAN